MMISPIFLSMNKMKVLITGGAGYIGSHISKKLVQEGIKVVIIDNLANGHQKAIPSSAEFFLGDINSGKDLEQIFKKHQFDAIFHLAADADLRESLINPLKFYKNNVSGTINLLEIAQKNQCHNFIFSSSFSIYGNLQKLPATENDSKNPTNPYSMSKLIGENILKDCQSWGLKSIALRYPNVAGCALDGSIGEDMNPFVHIVPKVILAAKENSHFEIYGGNFDTKDGTGVREYIHVEDLAQLHFQALNYLMKSSEIEAIQCNAGSGKAYSVKEIIDTTEKVLNKKLSVSIGEKKAGDVAKLISDSSFARKKFQWNPQFSDIETLVKSCWNWFNQAHQGRYKNK